MEFVVALFIFPALVALLAIGAGLLVDRVVGGVLPGVLIPPVGFALLVVVAALCTFPSVTTRLTPVAIAVVGVGGFVAGFARLRGARPDAWPVAAFVVAYLVAVSPVLLAWRVTVSGYLLDTTVAFHLAGADYLIEHGRDFARVPDSALHGMLVGYFGSQYPSGGQTLLGGVGRLVGTERIWLYQPFISLLLAFCTPALYDLARRASVPRPIAALGAVLGATPALVYAYAQMGAIKELTALPSVLLLGSLLALLPQLLERGPRGALVPAVVGAAGIGAIGFAFLPWLGATALAGLVLLLIGTRRDLRSPRALVGWVAALATALVVLAIPTFGPLGQSSALAGSFNASIADPGNLLRPLRNEQIFGIWIGGGHRGDPTELRATYLLIGVAALAALLGAGYVVRRRIWSVAAFVVVMSVVWVVLTRRGAAWTDAKLLVITSPMLILLVVLGVESLRRAGRRWEAVLIGTAVAVGIFGSNAFTYHDTNLQPTDRYRELLKIGKRFAGLTPTLTPEFDEFYFYALPDMATDSPGNAQRTEPLARLIGGGLSAYGLSYDLDQLPVASVRRYAAIVARRRPDASRPPTGFALAFRGDYYDVWRRTKAAEVLAHEPAGAGQDPTSRVQCSRVRRLARTAKAAGGELAYVRRPGIIALNGARLQRAARPAGWVAQPAGIGLFTPGRMQLTFTVRTGGGWRVWLRGDFAREVSASVDGKRLGGEAYQTGGEGNYARPLAVDLTPGRHRLTIERGGGSLRPGDHGPDRLIAIVLEPESAQDAPQVQTKPASEWRALCRQRVDWIEAVR